MRSRFALLIPLILFGCALTPVRRPWKLELMTSGGFTGKGSGSITIDSAGAVNITMANGAHCSVKATDDELKRYDALLTSAHPEKWRRSYAPENKCCDRIEYDLTLTSADRKYVTDWISAPLPMPNDLSALGDALLQTLRDHACAATS